MSSTNKSIQEKTTKLTDLVEWFNSDEFIIEQAMDKFKQAELLAAEINNDLSLLKNEIQIIKQRFDSEQ